jgi:hypothetical protein
MIDRELMQQALEALERFATDETQDGWYAISAIKALRIGLAQPEMCKRCEAYKSLIAALEKELSRYRSGDIR